MYIFFSYWNLIGVMNFEILYLRIFLFRITSIFDWIMVQNYLKGNSHIFLYILDV